jgi:DNA-binding PadR family transcriptional regulator
MTRRPLALELALLGFLREGPLHGYQIHQLISAPEGISLVWRLKQSQLYALLSRLEDEGYVSSVIQAQEIRPPRRIYQLTEKGRAAFQEWEQSPIQFGRQVRQEFLARLYFALREGKRNALDLIERQRLVFQRSLSDLAAGQGSPESGVGFPSLVHLYRAKQLESILNWLDACAEMILRSSEKL